MAWDHTDLFGQFTATANYSSATDLYTLLKSTGAGLVTQQTAQGGVVLGVLYNQPASGYQAEVAFGPICKVRVDSTAVAAIAVGNKLICSTSAAAMPCTGAASSGQYVFGRAMEAMASGTTGIITVHMTYEGAGSTAGATAA